MMKFLLLILGLSLNLYSAEKYPPMKDEYKNIEDMINKLESDIEPPVDKVAVGTANQNAVVSESRVEFKTEETTEVLEPQVSKVPVAELKTPEPVAEVKTPEPVVETKVVEPVTEPKKIEPVKEFASPVSEPVSSPEPEPVIAETQRITETQATITAPTEEIKSYIDEKSGKKYTKQVKIRESLKGTSVYESASKGNEIEAPGVYHFAYMPPLNTEGFNDEGVYDGKLGHFVFNIYGDYTLYYKAFQNRNTWGADVQLGGQFDINPFALAILMDASVRGANTKGVKLYGIGPRLRASYRVNSWIYPFLEGGVEFAKLENKSKWVYPYTVIGGGVMFRFGKIDRKSEVSLHKDFGVSQMLFVIAGEILTSPELNVDTPDCALIKAGLAIELF